MIKLLKTVLIFCICYSTWGLYAQEGTYFYVGWGVEKFLNTSVYEKIIADNSQYLNAHALSVKKTFEAPDMLNGLQLGLKMDGKAVTLFADLHAHSYKSEASWTDSVPSDYERQMKVSHNGFSMGFSWNFVSEEHIRIGPMFALNLEQFRTRLSNQTGLFVSDFDMPTDIFYFSTSLRFPFSFGGESFTFDLIPYYQLPFYKMNLSKLNDEMNKGFATAYTKDEMKQGVTSFGMIATLNFSLKKN